MILLSKGKWSQVSDVSLSASARGCFATVTLVIPSIEAN
jgi:hypothetical protein